MIPWWNWRYAAVSMAIAVCASVMPAVTCRAQTAGGAVPVGPDGQALASDTGAALLGSVYKDERAGIEIAPPMGSRLISRAGIDIMSFVVDAREWGGSVQTLTLTQDYAPADYLKLLPDQLRKTFKAVQVLDSKTLTFDQRPAALIVTSMVGDTGTGGKNAAPPETIALFREQLLVKTGPKKYIVLTFFAPLKDRQPASQTFDAMLKTFQILDPATLYKQRLAAVEAGKAWLAKRSAEELRGKLLAQPQLFRVRVGNREYGYIQFSEMPKLQDGHNGVLMEVDTRYFPQDGSRVMAQNLAFWANKHDDKGDDVPPYSEWDNKTETVAHGPNFPNGVGEFWIEETGTLVFDPGSRLTPDEVARLKKARDQMIAQGMPPDKLPPEVKPTEACYRMSVVWQGDKTQDLGGKHKPLNVPIPMQVPAPLPKILEYVWPRLVDLTHPSEMSFVVYNSAEGKLALRTLTVKGPETVTINGTPTACIKCLDELDPGTTTLWVDSTGKILMMRTSDGSTLTPTTTQQMQQLWQSSLKK